MGQKDRKNPPGKRETQIPKPVVPLEGFSFRPTVSHDFHEKHHEKKSLLLQGQKGAGRGPGGVVEGLGDGPTFFSLFVVS